MASLRRSLQVLIGAGVVPLESDDGSGVQDQPGSYSRTVDAASHSTATSFLMDSGTGPFLLS